MSISNEDLKRLVNEQTKRIAELESGLLKLSQSVEMTQKAGCISGWDFALTLPFARKVLAEKNK